MTENEEKKLLNNAYTMRRELIQKLLDDTRDLDLECGYPSVIATADYHNMYDRNGIASRAVKLWPEECWNVMPELVEIKDKTDTEFVKTWKELEKEFHVNSFLYRLDVLSGIGRFGCLLIGVDDGKPLDKPIDRRRKSYKLIYLKPMCEFVITVKSKETDTSNPRFGLPTFYTVKTEAIDGELSAGETSVHYSRILHVADNKGVSETFGVPRLQAIYNYCLDLKKTLGGSAEMFWKGGFPGYTFEVNKERTDPLTTEEKTELRTEFLNFSNRLQRYIALVGVTAKSLEPQVADPTSQFTTQLKAICITLGVPYRIFMGTEEAKLASTQDSKTWNRRVTKRQNDYLTSTIVRPFIDRMIELGVMPGKEYEVKWPPLEELDPKEASEVAKNKTESLAKYAAGSVESVMAPEDFLTRVLGFSEEEAQVIMKNAETWVDDHVDDDIDNEPPEPEPKDKDKINA